MTKQTQNRLIHHLSLLKSLGYKYHKPINFKKNSINKFTLPNNLDQLNEFVNNCNLCEFSKFKSKIDFDQGNRKAKIIFIDANASVINDKSNKIVLGKSGELLIKMIENVLNTPYEEFYFTNIIKCKTNQEKEPDWHSINSCKIYLDKQIELVNPKLIVALGEKTCNFLIDKKMVTEQIYGKISKYNGVDLITIYHPKYLLRNPSLKKVAYLDMLKIKSLLEKM